MKKKQICKMVLTGMMVTSLLMGCGVTQNSTTKETVETEMTHESENTEEKTTQEELVQETTVEETAQDSEKKEIDRTEVFAFVKDMQVGWNLGNTLDAHGVKGGTADETYWGNPETTKEMIDAIAAQGIKTIRIPVTWADHIGGAPDYKIDDVWMDRVKEVVDYAVDNDMYIILDTHHETDYWLKTTKKGSEDVILELKALWAQIATEFKDYNDKLIFEGVNEPRVKGSPVEWNGGNYEEREVVNALNQAFVETVRATGGNNETRNLMITTHANAVTEQTLSQLKIPADEHIIVSLHMYTPYQFTFKADAKQFSNWDGSRNSDLEGQLRLINKYILKDGTGTPVVITEFGAENKDNEEDVVNWLSDYLERTTKYGIPCVWWDNGYYTEEGEQFGIFNRRNNTWYVQSIADTLVEKSVQ